MERCSQRLRLQAALPFAMALCVAFCLATSAGAVDPQVGNIEPDGLQRGVETELTISGARLADAQELLFYSPGITVSGLVPVNENSFKAKVTAAPDCRLGIHAVRIRSATGVSNLRTFTVGNFAEVKEVEPNNDFTAPQPVAMNVTISAVVQNEDVDHFVVELKKGQRLNAELEGIRLGKTFFDPYVAILNAARFELARSDDAALLNQDCLCSIVAPEDGKYIVQVRESSFGGNGNCTYRLHVGSFPRPSAVYPAGGKPGEALQVRWIGDAAGDFTSQVTLPPANETNTDGLVAQDASGLAPSPNPIRVVDLQNSLEVEPNNDVATASLGVAPGALNGIIEKPDDQDFFKFAAKKGQQLDVRVYARDPLRSPLDSVLVLYDAKGKQISTNDDSSGVDSYLKFGVPADGDYLLSVGDQLKDGGPGYVYRVEISEVKPSVNVLLPERQQYIPTTLTVPRGNRMALMVSVQRQNFGGDLALEAVGFPTGMTLEALPLIAAKNEVPVIFTATADAAPAGALANLVAKSTDPKTPVVGEFKQRTMLIRGQNNTDVWGHDARRMAAVIAQESPFKIEIVQPKAPLVRNGSMNLKIVATRAAGFTAPIGVRMLYNPPGVASSASVSIPEGQTEALIPLTANGGAAIGPWKIVVTGSAPHQGANVEVATQFADLNVSDQFYKFVFEKTAVEQGQTAEVVVKVEKLQDFEGNAKCELVGLPAGSSTTPIEFNKDSKELIFKVAVVKDARPGRYTTLVCVTKFAVQGEEVTHTLGGGELRIDAPLPPKPDAPKPAATTAATPAKPAAPAETKRLSRLEQLRLEREKDAKK